MIDSIEKVLGVTLDEIRSKSRHADIVEARHILCFLMWKEGKKEREIASFINKDTSTVHYGIYQMLNLGNKEKINKVLNEQGTI